MVSKAEQAVKCFNDGRAFNCCQSVLSAYCEEYGLDRETALKIGTAFGSGMARRGDLCGALTGAMMVIGLKYGRTRIDDVATREKAYELVNEMIRRFKARNGSIMCRDLLGYDPSTPAEQLTNDQKKQHVLVCPKLIRDAAEIIEDIL
jgi:C_GCAxxG_C_C family probable redox protein